MKNDPIKKTPHQNQKEAKARDIDCISRVCKAADETVGKSRETGTPLISTSPTSGTYTVSDNKKTKASPNPANIARNTRIFFPLKSMDILCNK